jgi:hypothetical protein
VGKAPNQKQVLMKGELRIDSFSKSLFIEEKFEDTKWVIRGRKSKKNRQHNGQKRTKNDLQNTHKTKDRVTRTPLKIGGELVYLGRVGSSCSTSGILRVHTNPVISHA